MKTMKIANGRPALSRDGLSRKLGSLQTDSGRPIAKKSNLVIPATPSPGMPAETTDRPQIIDIYLQPGEFYFGDVNTRLKTLLGSCVAITMWHPGERIGGMCHYLLPTRDKVHSEALDGRYADEALGLFLIEIARSGLPPQEYEVKIFGGGNMFPDVPSHRKLEVGARNAAHGLRVLNGLGFKIKSNHLKGTGHRNVVFEVWSGDVWVRHSE
jgi:chemotaxis protein CheD